MNRSRWVNWPWLALLGFAAAAACGESGVVGGECASGYIVCEGRCIDPATDEAHCGSCNSACESGVACIDGQCGGGGEGGEGMGGTGGSGGSGGQAGETASSTGGGPSGGTGGGGTGGQATGGDAGAGGDPGSGGTGGNPGSGGTGGNPGSGGTGGNPGSGGTGGEPCVEPFNTPARCGDCETSCPPETPLCAPAEAAGYECVPVCSDGLTDCNDQCIDLQTDPLNCGRCERVCPSGVCVDGSCIGATSGHVVYICIDYTQVFQASAQTTLLGNAVFLPRIDPVRVLAYGEHADAAVMTSTDRAIRWAGTQINRTAQITRTLSAAEIDRDLALSNYDVLLVYDQPLALTGELGSAGAQLASTLDGFTRAGGVVVVLSGATGVGEMPEFASSAGLAAIDSESDYTNLLAYNQAPGDVVGFGVVTPFRTLANSCSFTTSETPSGELVFVVTDTDPVDGVGEPIVLHRTIAP